MINVLMDINFSDVFKDIAEWFSDWWPFLLIIAFIWFLRILMKNFIPSVIMCIGFAIATSVLSYFVIKTEDVGTYGPWIFYTTFSTLMYCLGPTYYFEGSYWELTVHVGLFSNSVDVCERSRGYRFYYFFSRLGITFMWVNIISFGGTPGLLYVIPSFCSLLCLIRLIKYFKD